MSIFTCLKYEKKQILLKVTLCLAIMFKKLSPSFTKKKVFVIYYILTFFNVSYPRARIFFLLLRIEFFKYFSKEKTLNFELNAKIQCTYLLF